MKNYYPEKPAINYMRTSVEMGAVVAYIQSLTVDKEVKRAAYIMFRNESGNGKSGINNNYAGIQADSGRWPAQFDAKIAGVVIKKENGTGKEMLFVALHSWKDSIDFLIDRVISRGLHVGGYAHLVAKMNIETPEQLAIAYKRDWVTGNRKYNPTPAEATAFLSMYRQAEKIFK